MATIEDELRAVLDGFSEHDAPAIDRRAEVGARISRHRRVRATGAVAALGAVAIAVTGGVLSTGWLHRSDQRPAQPGTTATEPTPKPGRLAVYDNGGKLLTSTTAIMPGQTTMSITFTPTSWDFMLGDACAAPDEIWLATLVNGNPVSTSQCAPTGTGGTSGGGELDTHEKFWTSLGVRLGEPTTVTAKVGTNSTDEPDKIVATADSGIASIGVYQPVAWEDFHFPPKPSEALQIPGIQDDLPNVIATLSDTASTSMITLPANIVVTAGTAEPGQLDVYLDGTLIAQCSTYTYGSVCSAGQQTVGTDRLAGFTVGERVTLSVVARHFPDAGDWRMWIS